MPPDKHAALLRDLGLTERDMERVRAMVDEAVEKLKGPPGPIISAVIDLDAEVRVFWYPPDRPAPSDATYIGTRQGWRIYATKLSNGDRLERERRLGLRR